MTYNAFASAGWDKENSTYRHEVYSFSRNTMIGYSKKSGFAEKEDKRKVFIEEMARLLPRWFTSRVDVWQVVVYKRQTNRKNGMAAEVKVAEFYPESFKFFNGFDQDRIIDDCIRAIYAKADKAQINALLNNYNDFNFDPKQGTYESLLRQCEHLLQFYERGIVERFFWAAKRQYFPDVIAKKPAETPATPAPPPAQRIKQTTPLKDLIPQAFNK